MSPTLEQLERDVWPNPEVHTPLIDACHRLRKVPIDSLTAADVRMLLGQRIGVRHLIGHAIALLESDPFLDASFFPGDLLICALSADKKRFCGFPQIHSRLRAIADRAKGLIPKGEPLPVSLRDLPALLDEYLG